MFYLLPAIHFYENVPKLHKNFLHPITLWTQPTTLRKIIRNHPDHDDDDDDGDDDDDDDDGDDDGEETGITIPAAKLI